ncbi:hypothetical protein [Halotalea alkalilenta]|uniref:hypothetical protein n=1 Tax=Halotalea alkalilenta TaxID=376489 RepID=UPI000488C9D2|nr:hypothetical protein [Halotalea alkalilenta]
MQRKGILALALSLGFLATGVASAQEDSSNNNESSGTAASTPSPERDQDQGTTPTAPGEEQGATTQDGDSTPTAPQHSLDPDSAQERVQEGDDQESTSTWDSIKDNVSDVYQSAKEKIQ